MYDPRDLSVGHPLSIPEPRDSLIGLIGNTGNQIKDNSLCRPEIRSQSLNLSPELFSILMPFFHLHAVGKALDLLIQDFRPLEDIQVLLSFFSELIL